MPGTLLIRVGTAIGGAAPLARAETRLTGHERWLQRRSAKLKSDFPDQWRPLIRERSAASRVAVVVHVGPGDTVGGLGDLLASIPLPVDLLVTNATGLDLESIETGGRTATTVVPVDDRGADVLPLIALVNAGLLDDYELVLVAPARATLPVDAGLALAAMAENPDVGVIGLASDGRPGRLPRAQATAARDLIRRLQLPLTDETAVVSRMPVFWARAFVLQGLRSLDLGAEDFAAAGAVRADPAVAAVRHLIGVLAIEAGYRVSEAAQLPATVDPLSWSRFSADAPRESAARVVPFYLPQFHPFDENNEWWGTGFTEWSNVAAAKPVFAGHNQPLLPGDLGFYDLRDPAVTAEQHRLASEAGLDGFMYYHYWFAGKKLMDLPIELAAAEGSEARFCIMWANENWTRTWDGSEANILIGQDYEAVPATQFIRDVMPLLLNPRYLRVDGKPVLAVYRLTQIPDYKDVLAQWREIAQANGLPGLHLLTVDVGGRMQGIEGDDPRSHGLDGILEFAPHNMAWVEHPLVGLQIDQRFRGRVSSFAALLEAAVARLRSTVSPDRYPGVMVNFDNTARRQWRPDIWYGSNPYSFHRWLRAAIEAVADRDPDRRVVFVNAWNEWAEGAVLEPSQRFGSTYLLAARAAVRG